ncbi:hypothetical protein C8J56DRAFT_1029080 [Mycena floridula]|nr:hypothetical protein C8J56DRAFT_1029080 [Mycena floridula]
MSIHLHLSHPCRASKRAEASRLLDPSYASSSSPSSSYFPLRVWMDNNGDLHDPDYRHFPLFEKKSSPRRTSSSSIDPFAQYSPQRPSWELANEEGDNASISEAEPEHKHHRASRPTSPSYSGRFASPLYPPSSYSSSQTSYDDSCMSSASDSFSLEAEHKLKKKRRERHFSLDSEETIEETVEEVAESKEISEAPKRSDAMKKEWQMLQLVIRIGVFRMRRRNSTINGGKLKHSYNIDRRDVSRKKLEERASDTPGTYLVSDVQRELDRSRKSLIPSASLFDALKPALKQQKDI